VETPALGVEILAQLCLPPLCQQMAVKSVQFLNTDVWSKELLWTLTKPSRTQQEQPLEKVSAPDNPCGPPCRPRASVCRAHRALERNWWI
jgi:hypothetical protein